MYDIIVIGAGPAGLTAALYSVRAGKSVLVLEKANYGGQMALSPRIENYLGFSEISGYDLSEMIFKQVETAGAELLDEEALSISEKDNIKTVKTDGGEYQSKAVIIATGMRHKVLGVENENEYSGNGISYCAACDGAFYKDKCVAVVGGGNSAVQEALYLCDICKSVTVIQNLPFEIVFSECNRRFPIGCGYVKYTHFIFGFFDFDSIELLRLTAISEQIF